ncbi:MAG: alpha/beta hydrolase fold domain-containing protein [Planctomycetota bacterium]
MKSKWKSVVWCAMALAMGAVSVMTAHAGTLPTPTNHFYGPHFRNSVHFYESDPAGPPAPVILFIHGGGWVVGSKTDVQPHVQPLLDRGFAVASMNYRFSQQGVFPAQIHDAKACVRLLRANAASFNIDPDRIGVFGFSAGANMAALLGTTGDLADVEGTVGDHVGTSSRVQAFAEVSGPIDLFAQGMFNTSPTSDISQLIGHPIPDINANIDNPAYAGLVELVTNGSANFHCTPDDPPALLMHGQLDTVVPFSQAVDFDAAIQLEGSTSTLVLLPNEPHEVAFAEYEVVYDFFVGEFFPMVPGDVTGEGIVNIDDLIMVINAFGMDCSIDPCPEDVNDSGMVNIDDILDVINAIVG